MNFPSGSLLYVSQIEDYTIQEAEIATSERRKKGPAIRV